MRYKKINIEYLDEYFIECPECEGDGSLETICGGCNGSGEGSHSSSTCRECRGSGEVVLTCELCEGKGEASIENYIDSLKSLGERKGYWLNKAYLYEQKHLRAEREISILKKRLEKNALQKNKYRRS